MAATKAAAEIEAVVRVRAEEAGLNPNHIWRDVKRRTEAGRLILHLLSLPDEWAKPRTGRHADIERHAEMASRVDTILLQADASGTSLSKKQAIRLAAVEFGVSARAIEFSLERNATRNGVYCVKKYFEEASVDRQRTTVRTKLHGN